MPRPDCDRALAQIAAWLGDPSTPSVGALVGTPGLGKTIVLRVLEERFGRGGEGQGGEGGLALYLPYAGLAIEDLVHWVYGLLGRAAPNIEDPEAAVAALLALGASPASPFVLLIDDADSMPEDTLRVLSAHLPAQGASCRLLLALNPDSRAARLMAALHALAPAEFSLRERLSIDEVGDYLDARMTWAGVPPVERAQLDEDRVHRLHSLSGGVPRALHTLAAAVLLGTSAIPGDESTATLDRKRKREDWMGRPIEDDLEI